MWEHPKRFSEIVLNSLKINIFLEKLKLLSSLSAIQTIKTVQNPNYQNMHLSEDPMLANQPC